MAISANDVKTLRDRTNAPMMECKAALTEAGGDMDKAIDILRKKIKGLTAKFGSREMAEGRIATFVDPAAKLGAILGLRCETAPVAKDDVPPATLAKELEIAREQTMGDPKNKSKPANILDKIIDGKMKTWLAGNVLLEQPFVKDDTKTVGQLLAAAGLKLVKFVRYKV